jgi:hypothetical protein
MVGRTVFDDVDDFSFFHIQIFSVLKKGGILNQSERRQKRRWTGPTSPL